MSQEHQFHRTLLSLKKTCMTKEKTESHETLQYNFDIRVGDGANVFLENQEI